MNKYLLFVGIGFELLGAVGAGMWISSELEGKYHSGGIITVFVFLTCLVVWFVHLFFLMKKAMSEDGK